MSRSKSADSERASEGDAAIVLAQFDAFIFDLDGVITRTAKVHAAAWKEMFDNYLAKHAPGDNAFAPFDIESDYLRYVDGKPRYDGVRSFLESRNIDLPAGNPGDDPGEQTICGLGNLKDELYHSRLETDGVEVYASSIDLLRRLRNAGIRTAVVSSSRNCRDVLQAAGIVELFDARVDGIELDQLQLRGKPAPDMFLEAGRRLGAEPQRCVGVEDATAGVQAAKAAGCGCVVGVNRGHQAQALYAHGADFVVADLGELKVVEPGANSTRIAQLPVASDHLDQIAPAAGRKPALFLDYDGTLTPIVSRPQDATLSDVMRETLRRLAALCPVAIVSGRDLADIRERVGLQELWYAGSHGFDIAGPAGEQAEFEAGRAYLPALDTAERSLHKELTAIRGCLVERKHFSIAVHYRLVAPQDVPTVKKIVASVHRRQPGLRLKTGKKIRELLPDVDWDKGKALRWLMRVLEVDAARFVPVYVGDDVTDEDAFRELTEDGAGIIVATQGGYTRARHRLDDPAAVQTFLNRLANKLLESRS